MGKQRALCALIVFIAFLLAPLLMLVSVGWNQALSLPVATDQAFWQTGLVAFVVVLSTLLTGFILAALYHFFQFPGRQIFHGLCLMPMAFPAYVLAFVYLGFMEEQYNLRQWLGVELQSDLGFLAFILFLSLTPYTYFFSCIGFSQVRQSHWEAHRLLSGSTMKFLTHTIIPTVGPFLLSAQVLVLFECLADFGAASVVNVTVITTLIYKLWFDLFSFSQAAGLALQYTGLIAFLLVLERLFRKKDEEKIAQVRKVLQPRGLQPFLGWGISAIYGVYLLLALVLPTVQLIHWGLSETSWAVFEKVLSGLQQSLTLGLVTGGLAVVVASFVFVQLRLWKKPLGTWLVLSSLGYSLPGSLLAVSFYALLVSFFTEITSQTLLLGLVLALLYKFLTVAMRPLADSIKTIPEDLFETSKILRVPSWRQWRDFFIPILSSPAAVAFALVVIEVCKEMPLTLMMAPGDFQPLSVQIFNYTSEGEWGLAAWPSLFLLALGVLSVTLINRKREHL